VSTERCREASCICKLEAHDVILTGLPAKSLRQDIRVRGKCAAGCLPASGAMTFYEFEERQVCLKLNRSAKTSTAHDHVLVSPFWRMRRNIRRLPRSIQRPQPRRGSRDRRRTEALPQPRTVDDAMARVRHAKCVHFVRILSTLSPILFFALVGEPMGRPVGSSSRCQGDGQPRCRLSP
jgi:hypothetical protein